MEDMTKTAGTTPDSAADQPAAERVVARLRPHARILFWPTIFLFAVCAATGYYLGTFPEQWQNLAVGIGAGALILLFWLLPLASWLNRRYTITTRRIIARHGFFVRTRQELLHTRGYDVTVQKRFLQSAFGSGDVRIGAGAEPALILKDVPNANLVQQVLHELMEASSAEARRAQPNAPWQSAFSDEAAFWNGR